MAVEERGVTTPLTTSPAPSPLDLIGKLRDEERRRREDLTAHLLLYLFLSVQDDLHHIAGRFGVGAITPHEFGDEVLAHLGMAHALAASYGRRRAGIRGPLDEDDLHFGNASARAEEAFLANFVSDLEGGRYTIQPKGGTGREAVNVPAIRRRLTLYAMGVAATANEAWAHSLAGHVRIWWVDAKDHSECDDCRRWALKGPYTRETLPAVPGDGKSACKRNCRCDLISETGERSFDLRHLFDSPDSGPRLLDF